VGLALGDELGTDVGMGKVGDDCSFAGLAVGEAVGVGRAEPLGLGDGDGDGQLGLGDWDAEGEGAGSDALGLGDAVVEDEVLAAARVATPATTTPTSANEVRSLLMASTSP
jgi:hypothetical protein